MKIRISDMFDSVKDYSLDLPEDRISTDTLQAAVHKKIAETTPGKSICKFSGIGAAIAVLALFLTVPVAAYTIQQWRGFSYIEDLTPAEIESLLKQAEAVSCETEDAEGNVTYYDNNGNILVTLTAKENEVYLKELEKEHLQTVQERTTLVNLDTMDIVPSGITQVPVDDNGVAKDFMFSNGQMAVFYPQGTTGYSLSAGDTVDITLNTDDICYLEFGYVRSGTVSAGTVLHATDFSTTIEIPEDGIYCFYVTHCSADMKKLTDIRIEIQ